MNNDLTLFKKENMKKLIYVLGAAASVVAPIVAVVSCGNANSSTKNTTTGVINQDTKQNFDEDFKVDGKAFPVKEDGIYLSKADYHDGVLWNGKSMADGEAVNDPIVKLNEGGGYTWNSLMLGDGDSVYVLYDKDDSDKMAPNSFTSNFFFNDSSVASDLSAANEKIGNAPHLVSMIPSADGISGKNNIYFGSQSNHMTAGAGYVDDATFQTQILKIYDALAKNYPDNLKSILDYYGVMINDQGQVVKNPNIHDAASTAFAPVFTMDPIFTYKRVAKNAYKITYHFDGSTRITAAGFIFRGSDGSNQNEYGSLSLGDKQEWDSYARHNVGSDASRYQAIKNVEFPAKSATPTVVTTPVTPPSGPIAGDIPYDTWKTHGAELMDSSTWWQSKQINGADVESCTATMSEFTMTTSAHTFVFKVDFGNGFSLEGSTVDGHPITDWSTIHVTNK